MAPMIISPPPVKDRDSSVCTNSQPTSVVYGCVLSDVNESRHMVYSLRDRSLAGCGASRPAPQFSVATMRPQANRDRTRIDWAGLLTRFEWLL